MKKYILYVLLMIGISSACITTTSSALTNMSQNLTPGSCLYISDLNTTITVPASENFTIVNVTSPEVLTDPISETTYNFTDMQNINEVLACGTNYTDSLRNVSIITNFPSINEILYVNPGQVQNLSTYNFTIIGAPLNVNENLSSGTCYSDPEGNISICNNDTTSISGPLNELVNFTDYGENYTNTVLNLTIVSLSYPQLNQVVNLSCGESQNFSALNLSFETAPCLNLDTTLNYSEELIEPGVDIRAPPACTLPDLNINQQLDANQNYTNGQIGLTVSCVPSSASILELADNLSEPALESIWQQMNLTNYTCGSYQYECTDGISDLLLPQEKSTPLGFIEGLNRIANSTASQCQTDEDKLTTCQEQNAVYTGAQTSISTNNQDSNDNILAVAAIAFFLVASTIFVLHRIHKKKAEEGAT